MHNLVLVAEDDPFNLKLLQEVCEAAGHRVLTAANGREVLDIVARERPDALLLDIKLSQVDGFEVIRILKSDPELCAIPIVTVTDADDIEGKSKSVELGAEDYVTKPYRVFEIQQRLRNALRLKQAQAVAMGAKESAFVDAVTLAGTAQQLHISLNYEFTRSLRYGHALTVFALRLRNHDAIRSQAGEDVADHVLAQLTKGFRACLRATDHVFRSQNSDLVGVLPETNQEGAQVVQQRLDESMKDGSFWSNGVKPNPDISMAHVSYPTQREVSGDALLSQVLKQLHVEKS
jgi:diguanylate cyclase (GGDEF)-like protein